MPHLRHKAEPDVAQTLVSGISGLHPAKIVGYILFTKNTDCGLHLTTSACCAFHAVEQVIEVYTPELARMTPCSGNGS